MDFNKLATIVLSDLALENIKQQEKLEFAINENTDVDTKLYTIKSILNQMAMNELMLNKFKSFITPITPTT